MLVHRHQIHDSPVHEDYMELIWDLNLRGVNPLQSRNLSPSELDPRSDKQERKKQVTSVHRPRVGFIITPGWFKFRPWVLPPICYHRAATNSLAALWNSSFWWRGSYHLFWRSNKFHWYDIKFLCTTGCPSVFSSWHRFPASFLFHIEIKFIDPHPTSWAAQLRSIWC